MNQLGKKVLIPVLLTVVFSLCTAQDLRIAAASNLSAPMKTLISWFSRTRNVKPAIDVSFASSGALASQIRSGAPFDLFLSADMEHPEKLRDEGFAADEPTVYALGILCLAGRHGFSAGGNPADLRSKTYARIALANPDLAPYGRAAVEVLTGAGLMPDLKDRLVYGTNISQVNMYVVSGSVDAGFINLSSVLGDPSYASIPWVRIPDRLYTPIRQGAIVLKRSTGKNRETAVAFLEFIRSETGRKLFAEAGYAVPDSGGFSP